MILLVNSTTKTSTTGKIFGSVNNIQLAESFKQKGFDIDRKQITITTIFIISIKKKDFFC
jgi:large subunit ribosomal protein L9